MKKEKLIYMYMTNNELNIDDIIDDFSGYLYTIIQNSGSFCKEDIEEIISDTYLILWNNKNKLDINKRMSPYLVGIVKNLIKKRFSVFADKKENIEEYENILIEQENIEIEYEKIEINKKIVENLNKLKELDRKIFYEFYFYSKKINEISDKYQLSISKVKTSLYRTRKKLKKEFLKGGLL